MGVEIKICGLTNYDDAMVAVEAGADYLGFVLYERSPRYVRPLDFVRLVDRLPEGVRVVPVCVNMPLSMLLGVVGDSPVHRVQLHGDELACDYADLPVGQWRALRLDEGELVPDPEAWGEADRFVLDAAPAGQYGGSGVAVDWTRARSEAAHRALMLAGGLRPENVAEAIRQVRPVGVDTSSGVERVPGRKDWAAVRTFVSEARCAGDEPMEKES
jgi:phosphoribosylanthranilate isomerase